MIVSENKEKFIDEYMETHFDNNNLKEYVLEQTKGKCLYNWEINSLITREYYRRRDLAIDAYNKEIIMEKFFEKLKKVSKKELLEKLRKNVWCNEYDEICVNLEDLYNEICEGLEYIREENKDE